MALASITTTYMDSDPEEDENEGDKTPDYNINNSKESSNAETPTRDNLVKRLVSYNDTLVSDAEGAVGDIVDEEQWEVPAIKSESKPSDEVFLYPEPTGRCSNELQEKINKLNEKMQTSGLDMNDVIQQRKEFRNPSIYEKLVQFCGIEELGSNYPPQVYDPFRWGKESYYEELALVQKEEVDKQIKERKDKTKIQFVSGTVKRPGNGAGVEDETKQRKSKWDQKGTVIVQANIRNPTGFLQKPTVTSIVTGTKGPAIPAFGALTKKPKV